MWPPKGTYVLEVEGDIVVTRSSVGGAMLKYWFPEKTAFSRNQPINR